MSFKPSVKSNTTTPESQNTVTVDYDALQSHVIEAAGTQNKHRTITGFIGGYYSLGKQEQTPYEAIYDESDKHFEKMKKAVEEGVATVREGNINIDGTWHNDVQIYSNPRPPREAIALGVYFPQIIVDKNKFIEGAESDPRPLMLLMGGEQFVNRKDGSGKKEKVIQYPTFIQENTNNPSGTWGLGQATTISKMGAALDLLNEHKLLKVDRLGEMLGKPLQFKMQVWNKPTKNGGTWYTEDIKFVSEVPEGLQLPEFDESLIHGINFDERNDPETVKHLRADIVNTIKRAVNYEGSEVQKDFEEYRGASSGDSEEGGSGGDESKSPAQNAPEKKTPVEKAAPKQEVVEPELDFSDDNL